MTEPAILDLENEQPVPAGGHSVLATKPYDPAPARESMRGRIALSLFWLLAILLAVILGAELLGKLGSDGRLETVVAALLTPVFTLFGTVMGFYFGERASAGQGR